MPDFVVKQLITRAEAYAGTGNWKPYDTLVIAVSYSTERGEQYRLLAENGAPVQDSVTAKSYGGLEGANIRRRVCRGSCEDIQACEQDTFRSFND